MNVEGADGHTDRHTELRHLAEDFCDTFYQARWPRSTLPPLVGMTIDEAYEVQRLVAQMRMEQGEMVVGYKVGCTSAAIRKQFGLREPIYGRLFAPHTRKSNSDPIDWKSYANCAIEPEIVFTIGKDLRHAEVSDEELVDAIERVSPGIELHHFKFWQMPPTTQELVCTGGIHAGLIIGDSVVEATELDFENELFSVFKDDVQLASGKASEIMGGPIQSLRWLVGKLSRSGKILEKGSIVIPGSPVELIPITDDMTLRVEISGVGEVTAEFRSSDRGDVSQS